MTRLTAVFVVVLFTSAAFAQQAQQQPEMVSVPKSMLTATQQAQLELAETKQRVETYGEWVGLGKEVGAAVNESLTAITHHTSEFAKTGVGKFTMFLIAYKIIGTDLIQLVIGSFLLLVGGVVWMFSYYRNCITRQVLSRVDQNRDKHYNTHEGTADEKIAHVIVGGIFLVFCAAVIFS